MECSSPSERVLARAIERAVESLDAQRARLQELRALSTRGSFLGSRAASAEPGHPATDDEMTAACMDALYAQTVDFGIAGVSEVIEDLERAIESAVAAVPVSNSASTVQPAIHAATSAAAATSGTLSGVAPRQSESTPVRHVHLRVVEL